MIEVKVSFDNVGEMLEFFEDKAGKAGKAGSVQQVAQVLKDEVQKVMAEPATPADQPITPQPQPAAQPITSQPQQPAAQPIAPQPPQPQAKQYTKDELARACATVMDKPEGMQMLQELLAHYKVVSLNDLDPDMYADFADKLRNLGVTV